MRLPWTVTMAMGDARRIAAALTFLAAALSPAPAHPHPHAWIDMRAILFFVDGDKVSGVRLIWTFDEYYTIYALDGLDRDRDGVVAPEALDDLLESILGNLGPYRYFTEIEAEGEAVDASLHADRSHGYDDGRLTVSFELTFDAPVDVRETPLVYAVFDPTYYIEMLHEKGGEAIQLVDASAGCGYTLAKPSPNFETLSLAASLDKTESAGDTLGASFAERVTIACE